jgi:hypothetical protein
VIDESEATITTTIHSNQIDDPILELETIMVMEIAVVVVVVEEEVTEHRQVPIPWEAAPAGVDDPVSYSYPQAT